MKFLEYFEDIEALKNKIECCNIEIAEQEGIKVKVMKELRRNTKRVPDEYNEAVI